MPCNFSNLLKKSFKEVGLKRGQIVYLGVDLGSAFSNFYEELSKNRNITEEKKYCSKLIFKTLQQYLGTRGTIIVPTFSFNFLKKKIYNKKKTPSDLGFFSNFILKQKNIIRSNHPINSIAVWGKNKNIINPCGPFSFGINSPFHNFIKFNIFFLNIGCTFGKTCTYVHHLEHLNGINHRYYKATTGKIFDKNKYIKKTYYNLVRYLSIGSKKNEQVIEKKLRKKKLIKDTNKNQIYISKISASDVYNVGMKHLIKNPSFFMSKKTIVYNNKSTRVRYDKY